MKLHNYLKELSQEEREVFSERCDSNIGHMRNVAYGYRKCGIALAVAIEEHSQRAVTRKDLRPDDWRLFWPELALGNENMAAPAAGGEGKSVQGHTQIIHPQSHVSHPHD